MNLALRAIFNLRRHRAPGQRVAVLVDAPAAIAGDDVVQMLRPWSGWLTIDTVLQMGRRIPAGLFDALSANGCQIVMLLSDRPAIVELVREECARCALAYVGAELAPKDSRELALFQEVLHHDYELGGCNEYANTDPHASPWVLRMLSAAHCRRQFPSYFAPYLDTLWQERGARPLDTIDVGCGALSRLRWGALNGRLRVTGVDPLLDMYAVVIERHGLGALPSLACARDVVACAEDLGDHLPASSYDVAYSSNALDHTNDPPRIIEALSRVLRPGGLLGLEVFTREGSREQWWQLHQFDMYVDDAGRFVCETRDGVVRPVFPANADFDVVDIPIQHDTVTAVVARRKMK